MEENTMKQYEILRSNAILKEFNILQQLEAITEKSMGRPEKYDALLAHIEAVKLEYTKPEEEQKILFDRRVNYRVVILGEFE